MEGVGVLSRQYSLEQGTRVTLINAHVRVIFFGNFSKEILNKQLFFCYTLKNSMLYPVRL